jgi:hypothetical protein
VFDTPENRVITSGLSLASHFEGIFGSSNTENIEKLNASQTTVDATIDTWFLV